MKRDEFSQLVTQQSLTFLDGATGTQLALRGMPQGVAPEAWVLENPESILAVQGAYRAAGSRIVYSPTFGGNRIKLAEFGLQDRLYEINKSLAELSRKAIGPGAYTFGDLAPTGLFVEPFGDMSFEDSVTIYSEQAKALLDGGVDGFVIETMMDIQEARAALLAVRELCDLPVMVSMTFDGSGRTLTGSDPLSALITLQSLGADAFGCNCSTGPAQMLEVIRELKPYATIPLLAKPNAGMPRLVDGETVFDMGADEFAGFVPAFIEAGVNLLGGCCGTTPDHIAASCRGAKGALVQGPVRNSIAAVSSARKTHLPDVDGVFTVIGERINPTGKKALQTELRDGSLGLVKQYAKEQEEKGASILDVNMGLSGINEQDMMLRSVKLLSQASCLPLCIDSTDPDVIESALRIYPGRALVNSVSAERERLEQTLPLVAKYGAMFVLLPLTDEGIPETLEERKATVEKVVHAATTLGLHKEDITVDGLVMTISSNQDAARVTLDLIEWCARELSLNTVCGLSNVSFGLPERIWVNAAFLAMAVSRGLSMAIVNPNSDLMTSIIAATDALSGRDRRLKRYVERFANPGDSSPSTPAVIQNAEKSVAQQVFAAVLEGDIDGIQSKVKRALDESVAPNDLVDNYLIPAIEKVGELFDKKEYFLPQLILSADAMREGFAVVEPLLLDAKQEDPLATIILATVQGDIHDIGKNIVALMLRNYGFNVIDLGKDVSTSVILDAAEEQNAQIIGLSALMTTTMVNMKDVVEQARKRGMKHVKFMIGGAVVDGCYANEIGADGYASDAMEAVRLAQGWA